MCQMLPEYLLRSNIREVIHLVPTGDLPRSEGHVVQVLKMLEYFAKGGGARSLCSEVKGPHLTPPPMVMKRHHTRDSLDKATLRGDHWAKGLHVALP